jgi:hypothetical protein
VVETGQPAHLSLSTTDPAGAVLSLDIVARSELTEVPEPSALLLLLLGSGLMGIAGFARKHRRATTTLLVVVSIGVLCFRVGKPLRAVDLPSRSVSSNTYP